MFQCEIPVGMDVLELGELPLGSGALPSSRGAMFRIHVQPTPPRHYRDAYPSPDEAARLSRFFDALLQAGILLIYSCTGAVSTPMSSNEVEQLVAAVDNALHHGYADTQQSRPA